MSYVNYITQVLKPKKAFKIAKLCTQDLLGLPSQTQNPKKHLECAMQWLCHAQDATGDGGVSAYYSLLTGWAPSYVETTGYIISTFYNYAEFTGDKDYAKRATQMADFELNMQCKNGAFPGGGFGKDMKPIVFNTGQVLFGMCRAYQETKTTAYKKSAIKAGDWLVKVMDKSGAWKTYDYLGHTHVYNTRTAWSLLRLHEITKEDKYKQAVIKNIDWALTQQHRNGWFSSAGFFPEQEPLTHTIAYTIRGILECGLYLKNKEYIDAALRSAQVTRELQREDGSLAGTFDQNWESSVNWSCLTGNSQFALIWQKAYELTKDKKYLQAAQKANAYNMRTQKMDSYKEVQGGLQGAFPLFGWYAPFSTINWGTKFYADALLCQEDKSFLSKLS